MASLEIGPLANYLDDDEIVAIAAALTEHDAPGLEESDDDSHIVEASIDEDALADFMDQLDANEAGCEVYMPMDFEVVVEVSGYRIGSAHALMLALNEMRDDMGIDEEEDDDDDDYVDDEVPDDDDDDGPSRGEADDERGALDLKDAQMRGLWRAFHRGATAAIEKKLPLIVSS